MERPTDMFDRELEWSRLVSFVTDDHVGATLGVVSGRRRQGKSFLLDALARAAGGFYLGATEAAEAESLRRVSAALTGHLDSPTPLRLETWTEVLDVLLALGRDRPVPVVLDEFPYLVRSSPSLPSVIQDAFGPRRSERLRSRTRLLLCGSAMSVMGRLLSGNAPLRGRAGLELVVHPFDHRTAADFWGLTDPSLAMRVHAVVGGTPAYRREFVRGDAPSGPDDFDPWVVRTVLDPASPLFREARYLLAEETDTRDAALYHSVLAAVASGNTTRGGIAGYLGRKSGDLAHPLTVLEDAGLLVREADAFRDNRSTYRITEPLVAFYEAVMRPVWGQLERPGVGERVWRTAGERFRAQVLGPHFERLCREWAATGDAWDPHPVARVAHGVVNDPSRRTTHEVDLAVVGVGDPGRRPPLLAIGEAKLGRVMGLGDLARLERIREVVAGGERYDTRSTGFVLCSGAGFDSGLAGEATRRADVRLVTTADLYA
ncbi:MAG: ATP-binding protein [Kineosporiaceae bacterium]